MLVFLQINGQIDEKKLVGFVASLDGQNQEVIDNVAEEISRYLSRIRVSPREIRAFIKAVHAMRIPGSAVRIILVMQLSLGKCLKATVLLLGWL